MAKKKRSLNEMEENFKKDEEQINAEMAAADELLGEAASKLHQALSNDGINKHALNVSYLMIDAAKNKRQSAVGELAKLRENRAELEKKNRRLLT